MKYNKKLLSESTKTTERGEKTKGKSSHGEQPRSTMTKSAIKKRIAAAKEMRPKKGQLPDHTVYQDMGYLMAESLGLVSEATRKDTYGGTGPDRMSKTPFKRKPEEPRYDSKKELKGDLASAKRKGKSFIGKGDSADNTIIVEPGTPLTPKQKKARATFKLKQQGARAKAAGKPLPKVIRRKKK